MRAYIASCRAGLAVSLPLWVLGIGAVAVGLGWPERAYGLAVAAGAGAALASHAWPHRLAGWSFALAGAPAVAAIIAQLGI